MEGGRRGNFLTKPRPPSTKSVYPLKGGGERAHTRAPTRDDIPTNLRGSHSRGISNSNRHTIVAVAVTCVHVGAVVYEQARAGYILLLGREHQRRHACLPPPAMCQTGPVTSNTCNHS